MVCVLLTSISLGVYNSYASPYLSALGISNVAGALAIGQIAEVAFIVVVPYTVRKLGIKWSLLAGMAMWGVRFALFILATNQMPYMALVGIGLQGICNDFTLIISAMYVDQITPDDLKAQAQSWLIVVISGFGSGVGSLISGYVYDATIATRSSADPLAWTPLWQVPIGVAILTSIVWICFFRASDHRTQ
jgi:MFS family permease